MRRWLFGDMLGPHFRPDAEQPVLLIESTRVLARRQIHRRKAHLVLSGMRHLAAELGDRALLLSAPTYSGALDSLGEQLEVPEPTSFGADAFVRSRPDLTVVRHEGFARHRSEFAAWAAGRGAKRLLLEDFYRDQRRTHDVLMAGAEPAGGRWNFDADNREPPPKGASRLGVEQPVRPVEDDIDAAVREDLDRMVRDEGVVFLGADGPRRFGVTRAEALATLQHFVDTRLAAFGPHEDAMLSGDPWLAHSLLSAPMNLGLLHPLEIVAAAENAYREGSAPLGSVEGFIRQVLGWREYIWGMYWHVGPGWRGENALRAHTPMPRWFLELDADAVGAACLRGVLGAVRDEGWTHHIPRLMVLGNWALQQGYDPAELADWFARVFVDGYDWVMLANVVGMSQHADGGRLATKPYASGGAYIDRMSDYCGGCRYDPRKRLGEQACPFTTGYWGFLDRTADVLAGNHRMAQPLAGLRRLADRDEVVAQHRSRGTGPP